ncbi:P-loop containing nucleoside triphosphate hydrolase protein [Meredithblackwellia eburnea MCA 4105]
MLQTSSKRLHQRILTRASSSTAIHPSLPARLAPVLTHSQINKAPSPQTTSRILTRSNSTTSSAKNAPPILSLKGTTVFPFGTPSDEPSKATFRDLNWTITDTAAWAILSSSSNKNRSNLIQAIQCQARFHPFDSASYPILDVLPKVDRPAREGGPRLRTVEDILQFVSFRTRLASSGGEFDDYTARYFSIRDEDKLTTRTHLLQAAEGGTGTTHATERDLEEMAKLLQIEDLLDLPLVTLSNGQTRRARILRALLAKPELLILEEPFTGLDVASRALLAKVLANMHAAKSPRMLLVLRPQDVLPSFITDLALLGDSPGEVEFGPKEAVLASDKAKALIAAGEEERQLAARRREERAQKAKLAQAGKELVRFNDVNVSYGPRKVLQNINWTIREGERWVLSGHNGSGKSTLLSVLLGDHPRSYMEDLTLFGKPRDKLATATLQANIGHVSPEILNAFPRKWDSTGLTVQESIVTGFESIFSYRKITAEQKQTLDELLATLGDPLFTSEFLERLFASLSPGEQSLVLLLRALVKKPPLLVLDEPFAGMDKDMLDRVKRFLETKLDKKQAAVLITHFEEEIPDGFGKTLKLEFGKVAEMS